MRPRMDLRKPLALLTLLLCACPAKPAPTPPEPSGRCEVDLAATGFFSTVGTGASAKQISQSSELIGGPSASGEVGDFLLANDRVRVIVERPLRLIAPQPYGGIIVDADLKRPAETPGADQLGRIGLLYAFGRTINVTKVEVLKDGASGGYAVLAATGEDALIDYVNVPGTINSFLPGVTLQVSPENPLPLRATTYYVLSPGESRVRMLTAFCNTSKEVVSFPVGDLIDQGGSTDFFNPSGCANGMGNDGCLVDPVTFYGYQGDAVAYGMRNYRYGDGKTPEVAALLGVSGVNGTLAGAQNLEGLLSWSDASATKRPGAFGILGEEQRSFLRDFFVGSDLGELQSELLSLDGAPKARLQVTAQLPDGSPAPGARVAVIEAATGLQRTLLVADGSGRAKADLPPGNYALTLGQRGFAVLPATPVTVPTTGGVQATLKLGESRTLRFTVKDPTGAPLTAKVTVLCPQGPCAFPAAAYRGFFDVERRPSNVAAIGLVPPSGELTLQVPRGSYRYLVSRGPEYSIWPEDFFTQPAAGDDAATDASYSATLAHVVDTTGYLSADLHLHSVSSTDSSVRLETRVLGMAAEGLDVIVSTDHDYITDYAPSVKALGAEGVIASMIGCEVSPGDYGHQQAYPVLWRPGVHGRPFDWAGGEGPSLRLDQLYAGLREANPGVVLQMNHPRGGSGSLRQLRVDTGTGKSHADPKSFRMVPNPAATADDTKLLSNDFDAFEIINGTGRNDALFNDWMTMLSRGAVKTATAVSDSHKFSDDVAGYSRTWAKVGFDEVAKFSPAAFAQALKAHRAFGGNGPTLVLTAQALNAAGTAYGPVAEVGDTLAVDVAAGDTVQLTVEARAPAWMSFDALQLFTHASGREAFDGKPNNDWPASRILFTQQVDSSVTEPVVIAGQTFQRIRATARTTHAPTGDTWYSAMLVSTAGNRSMSPVLWSSVRCDEQKLCTANDPRPFAYTNAILVDGDKSGAYDTFPLKQGLKAPRPTPPQAPVKPHVPTPEEARAALRAMMAHDHGEATDGPH